ncbi:signal peptidase II [Pseudonocardia lacus]|uniref:signal peptidase II n=1 Tax=Pseudonocardia lacus TaxID=2835865 RepID=UPI001BDC2E32|nr:signal peptidase II [Pseudonocardia lacus]
MDDPPAPDPDRRARASRPILFGILLLAVGVLVLDQLTKWWAESTMVPGEATPVLGTFIQWRLIYNPGAAFGMAADFTWILTCFAAVAVVALAVFATRVVTVSWAIGVGALLGGAVSHLGDRLLREPGFARGHIVDFIDYNGWFIGNVADIALVGGVAYLVLLTFLGIDHRPAATPVPTPGSVADEG